MVLVDIDKVMKTLGSEVRRVGETDYKIAEVKESMMKWVLMECEFNWIDAEKLRTSVQEDFPAFMTLQELRASRPDWVIKHTMKLEDACIGKYKEEFLGVSHCWETQGEPDPKGVQLQKLRQILREKRHQRVKYVFYDKSSLPQRCGDIVLTPAEKAEFQKMLPNINIIYLGAKVVIFLDETYLNRFWTGFEAWISYRRASVEGLTDCDLADLRVDVACIHGADARTASTLQEDWLHADVHKAHEKLSMENIKVTNTSDKMVQLAKLFLFDETVRAVMRKEAIKVASPGGKSNAPDSPLKKRPLNISADSTQQDLMQGSAALALRTPSGAAGCPPGAVGDWDVSDVIQFLHFLKLGDQGS